MKRPRPLRIAAAAVAFVSGVVLGVIPVLQGFDVIDWSAQQVGLVQTFVGTVGGGLTALFAAIWSERRVTPTGDPRDDDLVPFVPIANDGHEDPDYV